MSNRRKFLLKSILTLIILLMGVGTYSFFTADITGNSQTNNVVQTMGALRIEYVEGQALNAIDVMPGWTGIKTFTVKNTGTLKASYDIVFKDVINTFINDEVIFSGTCTSNFDNCESITQSTVQDDEFFIKQNINIEPNEEHSYAIELEFIETNDIQNYNIGAELSGKIAIYETNSYELVSKKINPILAGVDGSYLLLDEQGNIFAWGENRFGQLGDGTKEDRDTPVAVMEGTKFEKVANVYFTSFAITVDGDLNGWGYNNKGRLGDGTNKDKSVPTLIMPGTKFSDIAVGESHTLGLDEAGNLYSWGGNDYGQLGDGTTKDKNIPTSLLPGIKFKSVFAGYYHSFAIAKNNDIYGWGDNRVGQVTFGA